MAERLGVPVQLPSISPQPRTNRAFEVFAMADEQGLGHPFSMRALKAFFQEEKDLGDPEVLARLGADVGLDCKAVLEALRNGSYRSRHREALRHAREDMEITSVPTIVIGKQVFRGVAPQEELQRALEHAVMLPEPEGSAHDNGMAGTARHPESSTLDSSHNA
jgi:predicted DsbA family dithiol-disulfide isomerase